MKGKLLGGGLLVVVCVGLLAIKGISQGPSPVPPITPLPPPPVSKDPFISPPKGREMTFEQLAADLKTVRAKQAELKAQEEDILKKMAASIAEKRKDLEKAEEMLRQLQGKPDQTHRQLLTPSEPATSSSGLLK